jgi:heptaprenyl diphosphate synthase
MFGNMYAIIFGLAGGTLSILVMTAIKKTGLFGIAGISSAGGVSHNIGQLIVAFFTLDSLNLIYYVPLLAVSGTVCGLVTGIIAGVVCDRIIDIRFSESGR